MSDIPIVALVFFMASGITFVIAIFVLIKVIHCNRSSSKENEEKLTLLNEVMLIHTNEKIECQSQITGMKSE